MVTDVYSKSRMISQDDSFSIESYLTCRCDTRFRAIVLVSERCAVFLPQCPRIAKSGGETIP